MFAIVTTLPGATSSQPQKPWLPAGCRIGKREIVCRRGAAYQPSARASFRVRPNGSWSPTTSASAAVMASTTFENCPWTPPSRMLNVMTFRRIASPPRAAAVDPGDAMMPAATSASARTRIVVRRMSRSLAFRAAGWAGVAVTGGQTPRRPRSTSPAA